MKITLSDDPGQPRFWSVAPLEGQDATIRVNQFVNCKFSPARYERPRIEISILWIGNLVEYGSFLAALVLARKQWVKWNRLTGTECI